jgi:DUF4097 and DUF4098 domain-containing protein YvlB
MRALEWVVATALLCATAAANAEDVERNSPAEPRGEVEIVNTAGEVKVLGWDKSEVQVKGTLGRNVERLELKHEGGRTSIEVIVARGAGRGSDATLMVQVPRASTLSVTTVSAEQTIKAVEGEQRLQAVSGSVSTEAYAQEIEVRTVSGDVSVQGHGATSTATVTTVSGGMRLNELAGEVSLHTVNGDLQVRMKELTRARVRSTNGRLDLQAKLTPDARVDAEAINGDVRLRLQGADAEYDVETFNGEIDNCMGQQAQRTREHGPGNALRFKQGAATARVRVKTLNGGVDLCKQ